MKLSQNILFRKANLFLAALFFLTGCSAMERSAQSSQKTSPKPAPTFENARKEPYSGPKAKIAVVKFVDKSSKGMESSQIGDGMSEMIGNALLATNRFVVLMRQPADDTGKDPEADLSVEGVIKDFKSGIAGASGDKGSSDVTILLTLTDLKTGKKMVAEKVAAKVTVPDDSGKKSKQGLANVFLIYANTAMEKAIRMAVDESVKRIVANTPDEFYRLASPSPPKETPKPPSVQTEVSPQPKPPPVVSVPRYPVTQVVWPTVNLREGPGMNYKILGNAKKGTALTVFEEKGEWLRVGLETGKEVWVSKGSTAFAAKPPPTNPETKPSPM